jgi:Tol biopolymer transport system component
MRPAPVCGNVQQRLIRERLRPGVLAGSQGPGAEPLWSPDGRKIAFRSQRDGNFEIYVMNADGSGQRNLSRSPAEDDCCLAWSHGQK